MGVAGQNAKYSFDWNHIVMFWLSYLMDWLVVSEKTIFYVLMATQYEPS